MVDLCKNPVVLFAMAWGLVVCLIGCWHVSGPQVDGDVDPDAAVDLDIDADSDGDADSDSNSDNDPDGPFLWAVRAGGMVDETARSIDCTLSGRAVVTGFFTGPSTFGPGELNETTLAALNSDDPRWNNLYLAGYHADGKLAWAKQIGGYDLFMSGDMATQKNGAIHVTGNFGSRVVFEPGAPNETILQAPDRHEVYLAKYEADGTLAWATGTRSSSGTGDSHGEEIAVFEDGSIVVAGIFGSGPVVFGPGETGETPLTSVGEADVFIARFDETGALRWAKQAGGKHQTTTKGVFSVADGSVILAGRFVERATFGAGEVNQTVLTADPSGTESEVLSAFYSAKYDAQGRLIWARQLSDGFALHRHELHSVAGLDDGTAFFTGSFMGTIVLGPDQPNETRLTATGAIDVFVARFSPNGQLLWAASAGGTESDLGRTIVSRHDGSVDVWGTSAGSITFGAGEANETTLLEPGWFFAQYTPDGALNRAQPVPLEDVADIRVIEDQFVLVTGSFRGGAVFGSGQINETELNSAGERDIFVAKYRLD